MHGWAYDPRAGLAAHPGARDRPRLKVRVRQTILLKHFASPVIALLELWRAGKARTDAVGKIFEVRHRLTVIAYLGEYSLVRGGEAGRVDRVRRRIRIVGRCCV